MEQRRLKDFDCEVRYYKGEKEVRHPVPAYKGEEISSHTRMCRKGWRGDRIEVIGDDGISFELSAKKDWKGLLEDRFKLARANHAKSVLVI